MLEQLWLRIGDQSRSAGKSCLLKTPEPILRQVVYAGPHYFVPREDGRLIVGATLEDVGFDQCVTTDAVRELLRFALDWIPGSGTAEVERFWAGLRPASADGRPYMGRVPGLKNAFVATGHYRSGLILAPGTAVVMARLIRGENPEFDLTPFAVGRGEKAGGANRPPQ